MTPQERKVFELALAVLEKIATVNAMDYEYQRWAKEHLVTIKEALAQPEQEPVAVIGSGFQLLYCRHDWSKDLKVGEKLYTTPSQRKPLTSQERDAKRWRFLMENSYDSESVTQFHVWEHSWEPHSQTGEPTEWKQRVRGIALIDFIDRAIEAAHGIKE